LDIARNRAKEAQLLDPDEATSIHLENSDDRDYRNTKKEES
jgi:hypothetical protein